MEELAQSLEKRRIILTVKYSSTLHDREVRLVSADNTSALLVISMKLLGSLLLNGVVCLFRFSNGWIVKLGRGLDYFKRPEVCYIFMVMTMSY